MMRMDYMEIILVMDKITLVTDKKVMADKTVDGLNPGMVDKKQGHSCLEKQHQIKIHLISISKISNHLHQDQCQRKDQRQSLENDHHRKSRNKLSFLHRLRAQHHEKPHH